MNAKEEAQLKLDCLELAIKMCQINPADALDEAKKIFEWAAKSH